MLSNSNSTDTNSTDQTAGDDQKNTNCTSRLKAETTGEIGESEVSTEEGTEVAEEPICDAEA
jgi:hypothetical protein